MATLIFTGPCCSAGPFSTRRRDLRHQQLAERALVLLKRGSSLDALIHLLTPEAAVHTLLRLRSRRALALHFIRWVQPRDFFSSCLRLQCVALHLLAGFRLFGDGQALARTVITGVVAGSCRGGPADPKVILFEGLRDTQELCGMPGSSAVFDLVVKSYSSLKMVSEAVGTLDLATSSGYIPGTLAYNSVVDAMFRCKVHISTIQEVYDKMINSKVSLNVYSYNIFIRGYCSFGDLERGLEYFRDMERVGCLPNVVTFNTLIDAYCRSGRTDEALNALKIMLHKGIGPNSLTYNAILNGLCQERRMSETQKVMDDMTSIGLTPNEVTYNTLVNGYCHEGDVHRALELHAEMLRKGLIPDVVTYTPLISAMCRAGNLGKALEIAKQMRERGICLNDVTYTALIDGFAKKGFLEDAHAILNEMIEDGYLPSVVSYNALINGYCIVGRTGEALSIIQYMERKGLIPDVVTYSTILTSYCRNGELQKAFDLNQQMTERGVVPDKVTLSSLLRGLCEERRLSEAHGIFERMLGLNLLPDEFTYTTLIDGYCKEGDVNKAFALHDEMLKRRIFPDVVTYSVLINGLSRKARTHEARRLLLRLVHEDSIPNDVTYDVLIGHCDRSSTKCMIPLMKSFCIKGLMDEASRVFESMIKENLQPDAIVYSMLIHGYCRGSNVKKAFGLYMEMTEAGYVPNATCVISLVKELFNGGMTNELDYVIKELTKRSLFTDTEACKSLIDISGKELNIDSLSNILSEMVEDGLIPNSRQISSASQAIHALK